MKRADQPPLGFVFIDKPAGVTSHDVVARVRRMLGTRRVGHAGTLDPMATGVLVLGIGRATRLLSLASAADKSYRAVIRLGQSTTTDDAEGECTATATASHVDHDEVRAAAAQFVGHIMQRPSAVSAVKIDGKRAYARVRSGEDVTLPPRPVVVHEFEVEQLTRPADGSAALDVQVRVRCGSGTYVRALARDLGEVLGVGGHLTSLRRIESSGISLADCVPLAEFEGAQQVHPAIEVLGNWLPVVRADDAVIARLRHGQQVALDAFAGDRSPRSMTEGDAERWAVASGDDEVVAIATVTGATVQPTIVLSPAD